MWFGAIHFGFVEDERYLWSIEQSRFEDPPVKVYRKSKLNDVTKAQHFR